MSQDIVEQLRNAASEAECPIASLEGRAADTIESLRARVAELEAEETHLDGCVANWKTTAHKQAEQLAAQALMIKTMREALGYMITYKDGGSVAKNEALKIAYRAYGLPDNSTEILQEWLYKQLGEPVAFIRVSDEEDRLDGRDYEGHSLTNFVDPCGFQVFRKPEIK